MTKKRDMAFTSGQMVNNMTEHGKVANNTVKQFSETHKEKLVEVYGRTAKENNG